MKFPYMMVYGLFDGEGNPVERPMIMIELKTSDGIIRHIPALVDSGSDKTLINIEYAEDLGVELGRHELAKGIGNSLVDTRAGHLKFRIDDMDISLDVPASYIDSESVTILLGQEGFFDRFKISFDRTNREFELVEKKYKEMILAYLRDAASADGKIPKTKLAKLLYLADFGWFYDHLQSMSGMSYRKIQYGPVPDVYFRAIDELFEAGKIEIENTEDGAMLISETGSGRHAELSTLSAEEKTLIKNIAKKWKNKRTQEIVAFTHAQLPYLVSHENEIIPYEVITQENVEDLY
jgi:uncharacterized phage-associated protein